MAAAEPATVRVRMVRGGRYCYGLADGGRFLFERGDVQDVPAEVAAALLAATGAFVVPGHERWADPPREELPYFEQVSRSVRLRRGGTWTQPASPPAASLPQQRIAGKLGRQPAEVFSVATDEAPAAAAPAARRRRARPSRRTKNAAARA